MLFLALILSFSFGFEDVCFVFASSFAVFVVLLLFGVFVELDFESTAALVAVTVGFFCDGVLVVLEVNLSDNFGF